MSASPQAENGHIDIANEIAEAFFQLQLSGNQWRLLWVIFRQTYGWHKKAARISISYFERKTGMKRRHVVRALNDMTERNIITKNDTSFITTYGFQKDYTKWQPLPKKTYAKNGNGPLPKMTLKPLPKKTPIKETIKKLSKRKEYTPEFETFWKAYPRKIAKPEAFKAWEKNDRPSLDKILAAIEQQKQTEQWRDVKFIPHPATWINQGRWDDEINVSDTRGNSW